MGFLETVVRAKTYLREHGRVSFRGLQREFDLDERTLAELIEELVTVQQLAASEGKILSWIGAPGAAGAAAAQTTPRSASLPARAADGERREESRSSHGRCSKRCKSARCELGGGKKRTN